MAGLATLLPLAGCGPDYSPNTYASNAVQQANKVEQGVVVGVRDVAVSASATTGTVVGGAAGGIAGAQVGAGPVSAFSALGGSLIGGLAGNAAEHATGDTKAFEYIVRKANGDLVSVTQKDTTPLALGQKVLVIAGNQARVVPDYTVNLTPSAKEKAEGHDKPAEAAKSAGGAAPADATAAAPAAASVTPAAATEPTAPAEAAKPAASATAQPSAAAPAGPATVPAAPMPAAPVSASGASASGASAPGAPVSLTAPLPSPAATGQAPTQP